MSDLLHKLARPMRRAGQQQIDRRPTKNTYREPAGQCLMNTTMSLSEIYAPEFIYGEAHATRNLFGVSQVCGLGADYVTMRKI